jgi:hypothetical protein
MTTPPYIPITEAATLLGLSERQTRRLAESSGRGVKLGRNWFLTPEAIKALQMRNPPGPVPRVR